MSLINDALRRVSETETNGPQPPPAVPMPKGPPPLQPVEPTPGSPWTPLAMLAIGLLAVAGLLGLGGWLAWKAIGSSRTPALTAAAQENRVAKPAPVSPTAAVATLPAALPASNALAATSAQTNVAPATSALEKPSSSVIVPPVAAAPPVQQFVKWPLLKLQGIYFRPPKSSVMINNKTLFLEDDIQGVRVVEIGPQFARVTLGGQTNTLHLR